jgi:ribosome-associated protein
MQAKELQQRIHQLLDDAKAQNIVVLDVHSISSIADYMIIATGTSTRHVSAVADNLIDSLKKEGVRAWGIEGQDTGEWVLVDFGDVIVHIMQAETRDFYQLEKLWSGTDVAEKESSADQG